MGYIDDTYRFLPVAFDCLKNQGGVIHYHDLCRDGLMPDKLFGNVKHVAGKYGREVLLLNSKHVKSYAPGVSHVVLDIEVGEK
jgi:tRNA wybutosine-synthesizing protein 2